ISMPSAANFMCTGLVTLALFFGSTKWTLIFLAFAALLLAGCFACAAASAPNARTMTRIGRARCLLSFIRHLLSRGHCSEERKEGKGRGARRTRGLCRLCVLKTTGGAVSGFRLPHRARRRC